MFDLGSFLPYLINRTGVRLAHNFGRVLQPHGVGLQEWRVLAAVFAQGEQRMSELADLTSIDRTTLSRLTGRMEAAGLVQRRRQEDDAREVHVALTDKGRAITQALTPSARRYEDVAMLGFSPQEIETFKTLLRRVYANLDKL